MTCPRIVRPAEVLPTGPMELSDTSSVAVTQLLHRWRDNDLEARDRLFEVVYRQLRQMAVARLRGGGDAALQPTVLVHEAMLRLLDQRVDYADRAHFLALASLKMRSVLVDMARRRSAAKRGGGALEVTLSLADLAPLAGENTLGFDALVVEQVLRRLAGLDPRAAATIEYTYFGGMNREEIALVLGVSVPTVDRDLRFAKAWLNRELAGSQAGGE